jgi:hypothetical protein
LIENSGLIDLRHTTTRNFEKFFLKRNPFPPIGIPGETILFTVDRAVEVKRFQDAIAELVASTKSNITVLIGEYGSGKSHLMRLFKQSINAQLLSREKGVLATYLKSPGEDFRDFYLTMVEDIGRPLLTQYAEDIIREHLVQRPIADSLIFDMKVRESFLKKGVFEPSVLRSTQFLDLVQRIRSSFFSEVKSADVVHAFLSLAHPDHSSKAWRWLISESLNKEEKGYLGVEDDIENDEKAYAAFRDLITLFHKIGVASLCIIVDELEKITLISSGRRSKYQDALRAMIDDHPSQISFYFAIAPRQWESLTKEPNALVRRLTGNWQVLENFEKGLTRELIERYLFFSRTEHFTSKDAMKAFPDCEASLCPFTTGSIEPIQKITDGLVSSVILLCRRLLEFLHDHPQQYKSITPTLVDEVVKNEQLVLTVEA